MNMNIKELLTKIRPKSSASKDDEGTTTIVQNETLQNSLEKLNTDGMLISDEIADMSKARVVVSQKVLPKEEEAPISAPTAVKPKSNVSLAIKESTKKADTNEDYPFQHKEDHIGFLD